MLDKIKEALEKGQVPVVAGLIREAKAAGLGASEILSGGLLAGMEEVGVRFGKGELFIPEVMLAARAMQAGMDLLKEDLIGDAAAAGQEKIVLGTVQGDQHDIGKNLVRIMLTGAGYEVIDLGVNVPAEKFVQTAKDAGARLIGLSALLTTTMVQMEKVVSLAHAEGIRVMIGGAPVTGAFAEKIGADGYSASASEAAELAGRLLQK